MAASTPAACSAAPGTGSGRDAGTRDSAGAWRMVAAMVLSGTIGLVVVESQLAIAWVVLLRCALGALGLGAWLAWRRAWQGCSRSDLRWMALGGVALVANWVALFHAYAYIGIAAATVVYHVQPFLLVLAAALTGEAVGWRQLPWMLPALAGVVLTSGMGTGAAVAGAEVADFQPLWGVALAMLAAALYTVTVMATRRIKDVAPAQVAMVQMMAGGAALALASWSMPSLLQDSQHGGGMLLAQSVACVLILGFVHTALMYGLMYGAFQRLSASAIAMLSFIYPAVALAVDLGWFGARPGRWQWLGMGLIVAAVTGYRRQEGRARR